MKKLTTLLLIVLFGFSILNAAPKNDKSGYDFVDATRLTVVGKLFNDTKIPFHRVDTSRFKGFTEKENLLVRESSGIAIAFKTDSPSISIIPTFGFISNTPGTMGVSSKGFDLYIKDTEGRYGPAGEWVYAESRPGAQGKEVVLKDGMDDTMKEFLLYLPTYSEVYKLMIGVEKGHKISKIDNPFRHRIGIFGSSFTHGASTSRSGMTYPAQLSRMTGLQFLSLGVSGNCKLQSYFADVLAAADVDALVFDAFSNPSAALIEKELFPFIEAIQAKHPGIPLIFQQTIYRETRNFNAEKDESEARKMMKAEEMMAKAMEKYENVYFVIPSATSERHDTSVDGTHPSDYGYYLWAESVREPILEILAKYGIN